ncbi:putative Cyclin, Cyclin-related protein, partial [Trachipleistophora hominis]
VPSHNFPFPSFFGFLPLSTPKISKKYKSVQSLAKPMLIDITNLPRIPTKTFKLTIHRSTNRAKLLRWLFEVTVDFKLMLDTHILAIRIFDFYVENMRGVCTDEMQKTGICALFLASKLFEVNVRRACEYACVTGGACTEEEMVSMERMILERLNFEMPLVEIEDEKMKIAVVSVLESTKATEWERVIEEAKKTMSGIEEGNAGKAVVFYMGMMKSNTV